MNLLTIAGHLGADPETRFTSSGQKVTTLRVAAKARRGSKDETIWWRVTVWGEQFDKMIAFLKKGSAVMVAGEMSKPEIFTDRDGQPQISMNMTAFNVMFSPFGRPDQGQAGSSHSDGHAHSAAAHSGMATSAHEQPMFGQGKIDAAFNEDEIPF